MDLTVESLRQRVLALQSLFHSRTEEGMQKKNVGELEEGNRR